MNEIDNYKYIFFKSLYTILGLSDIEKEISNQKNFPLEIVENDEYDVISNYFFLLNEININKLNEQELQQFYDIFSKKVKQMTEDDYKKAELFIKKTYQKLFFDNIDQKFVYYGPINMEYASPSDAITLGLYYDASNDDDFEKENKLNEIINYIQFQVAKKVNIKVAVILYNQLTLDNYNSNLLNSK